MNQFLFIVPEALLDQATALRDAFEATAGARVLDFGPARWRDMQGSAYSVAAGLLDPDWIAHVQAQNGSCFATAQGQSGLDPEAILLIECHTPLQVLERLGLTWPDDGP